MTAFRAIIACAGVAVLCATVGQSQEKKYDMIPIKYDGLKAEVLKHRGKVLVVDLWAGY